MLAVLEWCEVVVVLNKSEVTHIDHSMLKELRKSIEKSFETHDFNSEELLRTRKEIEFDYRAVVRSTINVCYS